MATNKPIVVDITGDASGLQSALAAARRAVSDFGNTGEISAKQFTNSLRGLPAQFTDIFTSLAGGQQPLMVFLQQGGQIKDMFGGLMPALGAVAGGLTALVNPISLTVTALGALGLAAYQGMKQNEALAESLINSGNYAGQTASSMVASAQRIAAAYGISSSAATAAVTAIAANGQIGAQNFSLISAAAARMSSASGAAIGDVAKQFADLAKDPLAASVRLNESTNFLTESVYRQIKALQDRGDVEGAADLAQRTYATESLRRIDQVKENLGLLEKSWNAVTGTAKDAWAAMMNVGKEDTTQQKIDRLRAQLSEKDMATPATRQRFVTLQKELDIQLEIQRRQAFSATYRASEAESAKTRIEWDRQGAEFATKRNKAEQEIAQATALGNKLGLSRLEIEKRIADIQAKYKEPAPAKPPALRDATFNTFMEDMAKRRAVAEEELALTNAQTGETRRLTDAEKLRTEGLQRLAAAYSDGRLGKPGSKEAVGQLLAGQEALEATAKARKLTDDTIAQIRSEVAARAELIKSYETYALAIEGANDAGNEALRQSMLSANNAQFEASLIGKTADETARLRQERELLNRTAAAMSATTTDAQRQGVLDQVQRERAALEQLRADQEDQKVNAVRGMRDATTDYLETVKNVGTSMKNVMAGAFKGMEDALISFTQTGKLDFTNMTNSILADILRIKIQQSIVGPLAGAAGGSGMMAGISNWLFNANGNAFTGSGVQAFAKGGAFTNSIVNSPTPFKFASGGSFRNGVMGEAGPEAVMPLTRGPGGKLGVQATGGGGANVIVQIIESSERAGTVEQSQDANGDTMIQAFVAKITPMVEANIASRAANNRGQLGRALNVNRAAAMS